MFIQNFSGKVQKNYIITETGLFDFHKLTVTVLKNSFKKLAYAKLVKELRFIYLFIVIILSRCSQK